MNYFHLFDFIKDRRLRKILILDYKEVLTSLKRQASKAAVVLSGGITEAILKDLGQKKKNRDKVESEYKKISNKKGGTTVKDMDLYYLIRSLENLKLISSIDASTSNILRDYRNMIHPFKYLKRPTKRDANLTKQLLDNLLKDRGVKGQNINSNEKRGKLFFTDDYYKAKRSKKEYKEIIRKLYKKKIVTFQEIKSLKIIREKSNSAKSAASLLNQLSYLGICDYDKNSWQDAPIRRYEKWIFNRKFNFLARRYLK